MSAAANAIVLNGSHGEGGSALIRSAVSMSVLTQQPLRIHSVRGATRRPGLTSEDLSFIRTLAMLCSADLEGDDAGSEEFRLEPKHAARALNDLVDTQNQDAGHHPGHAAVVAAALVPILCRAGAFSEFSIKGETHSAGALSFDAFDLATCAVHRAQGIHSTPKIVQAGYGFGSRGEIHMEIEPSFPEPIVWHDRGECLEVTFRMTMSGLSDHIAQRGSSLARKLGDDRSWPLRVEIVTPSAKEIGIFVTLVARFERGCAAVNVMGAKGVRIENLVTRCFEDLTGWMKSDASVDPYLADQILLPAVLAQGSTVYKTSSVTRRLITMAWVIKQFIPMHITVLGREGEPGTITIEQ